ncbi:hypothetical protein Tco_0202212, partial [Tanacetum coccineum]
VLKNGNDLSADLARKRLRAASFSLRLCISFNVRGDWRTARAFVFLGLALIPSEVTMYPRNFPSSTPKEHFFGFGDGTRKFNIGIKKALILESHHRFYLTSMFGSG